MTDSYPTNPARHHGQLAPQPYGHAYPYSTPQPYAVNPQAFDPRRNFANAIAIKAAEGYRCESQTDVHAIMVKGQPTNHLLHAILTMITFGVWALVWLLVAVLNKPRRVVLSLDEYGNVLTQWI